MNTPVPRRWWITLFLIDVALSIFVVIRVILGHSPLAAFVMSLSSICFITAQLHRRAIILWWALAFTLATIGLVLTLLPSR